ncbi:hypothetical protein [Natronorubrum thiooxidans]|uniref:Uncharacterized protein n=1 Tax=Natronorubrum thiooxidans TaxID=308853 RepID=A0A1N7HAG0_9EURY|nr:hypothetical protein [Natronorubrum thiooxidans]SIS21741.1 hypothetical protein SAMN05421752_1409 [Natronorubrum thiooxidans]
MSTTDPFDYDHPEIESPHANQITCELESVYIKNADRPDELGSYPKMPPTGR